MLSALARSPECEQLLKFVLEHDVGEIWGHPRVLCHVNGRVLSADNPVGDPETEMIVHLQHPRIDSQCSVHLSTLISLAVAYIKYQYEAVAAALMQQGQPVDWVLEGEPEALEARGLTFAALVARHGPDSEEALKYHMQYLDDNAFIELAALIRTKHLLLRTVEVEHEAKIRQQRSNNATRLLKSAGLEPSETDNG